MKFVIILVIFTYHASAADPDSTTQSTVSTEPTTQSSVSTDLTTQSSVSTAGTTQSSATTAEATAQASTTVAATTPLESPAVDDTTPQSVESSTFNPTNYTSEPPVVDTNTTVPILPTSTTTPNNGKCYPNDFPFGDGCISPQATAGVVITALVLSLISFVGALVSIFTNEQ